MSYLDEHLLAGERIVHRTRPHWIMFALPLAVGLAGAALALALHLFVGDYWYVGAAVAALGILLAIGPAIRYLGSEFAVSDKRVLARTGLVQRESTETLLSKIEAISVDQDLAGRMLGFGTIAITGTGGTREELKRIPRPLEFRRQVQSQIVAQEERSSRPRPVDGGAAQARVERECPFCAEPILARARVCKHCGRDVEPL
ncbi:MAG: PH domain-containing protein [Gemmatimonadales bacterium]|nr:PH domain-containing protein [Gemmatimonadales bacterium]MDQ3427720.1 PH domain-containing protein [Gemmatimonadota bacterium]